jgi:hypothetical protein
MYLIIESVQTNSDIALKVLKHVKGKAAGLALLWETVQEFISLEGGRAQGLDSAIIDVKSTDNIPQPDGLDGFYVYRSVDDCDKLFLYRKQTKVNRGYIMNSVDVCWELMKTFYLCSYDGLDGFTIRHEVDLVVTGSSKVKVPKPMTISPFVEMLDELKKNNRFICKLKREANGGFSSSL